MRITIISDTHGLHEHVTLPGGDLLIHCGDVSNFGEPADVERFLSWYRQQEYANKVFIAGNHDWLFQSRPGLAAKILSKFSRVVYLQDGDVEIAGLKLYGSPWSPEFCHWAFNLPRRGVQLAQVWSKIPDDTDILITHTAPYGILDADLHGNHAGCEVLARRVSALHLKAHVFGHLHAGHGVVNIGDTHFVNASTCNDRYEPINEPVTLELQGA